VVGGAVVGGTVDGGRAVGGGVGGGVLLSSMTVQPATSPSEPMNGTWPAGQTAP
jgi:hypothetical protein